MAVAAFGSKFERGIPYTHKHSCGYSKIIVKIIGKGFRLDFPESGRNQSLPLAKKNTLAGCKN